MTHLGVLRVLMGGAALLMPALEAFAKFAPAPAGQGGVSIHLPFVNRPVPPPGACKHLEAVKAWQVTVDVAWSDTEGPTVRSPNGYPQTFNATAQQTLHAITEVPSSDELIFEPGTNAVVGRVFKHALVNGGFPHGAVTGTSDLTADESIYTPPDGAGGGNTTVRWHYASSGSFVDSGKTDVGIAKVTVFGDACKLNLDITPGKVNLEITIDGNLYSSQPNSTGSLYLRQIGLSPDGVVNGQAQVAPNLGQQPGSPFVAAPPWLGLMAVRTSIRAWRNGGPLRVALVTWRLAPLAN